MTRLELLDRIVVALEETLGQPVPQLTEETQLFGELNVDSTSIIELLMTVEDVVAGFQLDPDDLNPDDLVTVGTLLAYVERHLSTAAELRIA